MVMDAWAEKAFFKPPRNGPDPLAGHSIASLREAIALDISEEALTTQRARVKSSKDCVHRLCADADVRHQLSVAASLEEDSKSSPSPRPAATSAFHELLYQQSVVAAEERERWREEELFWATQDELEPCTFTPCIDDNSRRMAKGLARLEERAPDVIATRKQHLDASKDLVERERRREIEGGIPQGYSAVRLEARATASRMARRQQQTASPGGSSPRCTTGTGTGTGARTSSRTGTSSTSSGYRTPSSRLPGSVTTRKEDETFIESVERRAQERRDRLATLRSNCNYSLQAANNNFRPRIDPHSHHLALLHSSRLL